MKKILILVFVLVCYEVSAQEYHPMPKFGTDTIAYMQYNFIDRQDQYIGKTLDNLLKDYELPLVLIGLNSAPYTSQANGKSWFEGVIVRSPIRSNPYGVLYVFFRPPLILAWTKAEGDIVHIHNPTDYNEWREVLKDCIIDKIELDVLPLNPQ